jgi:hypothetical protein
MCCSDRHPGDRFLPVATQVFGSLHKEADDFMASSYKSWESLSFPLPLLKLNKGFQLESPPSQDGLLLGLGFFF